MATGPRGTLLTVADGHNGQVASLVAVDTVLDRLGDDPPGDGVDDDDLVALFDDANAAIVARGGPDEEGRTSATTLTVVLVGSGQVQWASIGDSVACVAAPRHAEMLAEPNRRFLGYLPARRALGAASVAPFLSMGSAAIPAGAWVIVATDGYSDWAPKGADLARATALWTAGARDAATVVDRLMDKARVGGAGDNVAIAVARS